MKFLFWYGTLWICFLNNNFLSHLFRRGQNYLSSIFRSILKSVKSYLMIKCPKSVETIWRFWKYLWLYWNRPYSIQIVGTVLKPSKKDSNYPGNIWTVQKVLLPSGQYWTCVEILDVRNESLNMWERGGILPPKEKRKSLLCQTFISEIYPHETKKTKEKDENFHVLHFFWNLIEGFF